jgi:hypothetical protein
MNANGVRSAGRSLFICVVCVHSRTAFLLLSLQRAGFAKSRTSRAQDFHSLFRESVVSRGETHPRMIAGMSKPLAVARR